MLRILMSLSLFIYLWFISQQFRLCSIRWQHVWQMIDKSWIVLGRKLSLLNVRYHSDNSLRDWVKPETTTVRIASIQAKILTWDLHFKARVLTTWPHCSVFFISGNRDSWLVLSFHTFQNFTEFSLLLMLETVWRDTVVL